MGQESTASLVRGRTRLPGRALLEGDHILFRGESEREKLPFSAITTVEVKGATLVLSHAGGTMQLVLAPGLANTWATKIRNPRSRLDKLGVKAGMVVAVVGVDDPSLGDELRARGASIVSAPPAGCEMILFGAESPAELSRLATLRKRLAPAGAIWVVHRKGKGATLKDVQVFAAAKAAGLVDNKVASFSETHTAERLVIPRAAR